MARFSPQVVKLGPTEYPLSWMGGDGEDGGDVISAISSFGTSSACASNLRIDVFSPEE